MRAAWSAPPLHPATRAIVARRAADLQLRVADHITAFAGSMPFGYLHAGAFAIGDDRPRTQPVAHPDPRRLPRGDHPLDLRHDHPEPAVCFPPAKAEHDFVESELELKTNTELTRHVHALTTELHRRVVTLTP